MRKSKDRRGRGIRSNQSLTRAPTTQSSRSSREETRMHPPPSPILTSVRVASSSPNSTQSQSLSLAKAPKALSAPALFFSSPFSACLTYLSFLLSLSSLHCLLLDCSSPTLTQTTQEFLLEPVSITLLSLVYTYTLTLTLHHNITQSISLSLLLHRRPDGL